jgi:hypothetical protein
MFTTPVKIINADFNLKDIEIKLKKNLHKADKVGIESRKDYYYKVNFDFANISEKLLEYSKPFLSELGMKDEIEIDMWGNYYPGICVCGKHVLLLFPPYLVHDVVMLSNQERITVAFDIKAR